MITASIFEAKTNLSQLVKEVQKGEMVTITTGRARTPVAQLLPVEPVLKKRLGALETPGFALAEAFFEPLADEDLQLWNGDGA
jgi:prevent-host-death family protein